jgi:hypothetical protein
MSGSTIERLVSLLFDGDTADPIAPELTAWLAGAPRFRAFVEVHRDKICKKLRGAAASEARRDVRAELRVAHLLLADRRVALAFEPGGSRAGGPVYAVTFRGVTTFNLEVTRPRRPLVEGHAGLLLAKLRQLPTGLANAVLLAVEDAGAVDIGAAMRAYRASADRKEEAFFSRAGFDGTRGFYDRFLRLGGVFVWREHADGDRRATLWTNRSARIPLPQRAVAAVLACLRGDP